jgi:hypothetical protein
MQRTTVSCNGPREHATPPRGRESTVPPSQPPLPTDRVFVVQFRAQPTGVSSVYDGRVEHLVSGQVARFHSLEELLGFIVGVLADVQEQSGAQ